FRGRCALAMGAAAQACGRKALRVDRGLRGFVTAAGGDGDASEVAMGRAGGSGGWTSQDTGAGLGGSGQPGNPITRPASDAMDGGLRAGGGTRLHRGWSYLLDGPQCVGGPLRLQDLGGVERSEERRVGKGGRAGRWTDQ